METIFIPFICCQDSTTIVAALIDRATGEEALFWLVARSHRFCSRPSTYEKERLLTSKKSMNVYSFYPLVCIIPRVPPFEPPVYPFLNSECCAPKPLHLPNLGTWFILYLVPARFISSSLRIVVLIVLECITHLMDIVSKCRCFVPLYSFLWTDFSSKCRHSKKHA